MLDQLREYGLSEKEARVYISCLKLGSSTANKISSMTGLRRSTTYDVLEALKQKGLIASFSRDKKHYFQAVEPTEFLTFAEAKVEKLKKILPELERIKGFAVEKPHVELFEGFKGVTSLLESLYREKEVLLYGSLSRAHSLLKHLPYIMAKKRAQRGIPCRTICEHTKYATFRLQDPEIRKYTHIRYLASMKNMTTSNFVAGNQVGIIVLEHEPVGIHIINKEIAKTQRYVFEALWKVAEP